MSEERSEQNENLKVLSALDTVLFAFNLIEQKTWISLGLIKDVDGEFHKSRDDARFLIDLLDKMALEMQKRMDKRKYEELKDQVATLQLNFVNQFK